MIVIGYIGEREQLRKVVAEPLPDELDVPVEAPAPVLVPEPVPA